MRVHTTKQIIKYWKFNASRNFETNISMYHALNFSCQNHILIRPTHKVNMPWLADRLL